MIHIINQKNYKTAREELDSNVESQNILIKRIHYTAEYIST